MCWNHLDDLDDYFFNMREKVNQKHKTNIQYLKGIARIYLFPTAPLAWYPVSTWKVKPPVPAKFWFATHAGIFQLSTWPGFKPVKWTTMISDHDDLGPIFHYETLVVYIIAYKIGIFCICLAEFPGPVNSIP